MKFFKNQMNLDVFNSGHYQLNIPQTAYFSFSKGKQFFILYFTSLLLFVAQKLMCC